MYSCDVLLFPQHDAVGYMYYCCMEDRLALRCGVKMIRTGLCRLKKHDKIANVQLQFPHPKDYRLDAPIAGVNRLWLAF